MENENVDPTATLTSERFWYFNEGLDAPREEGEYGGEILLSTPEDGNVVSSLCEDGYHRPALDIDVPCHYVPSSTPGHGHLYFPTIQLTWVAYNRLLKALADAGIIESGYLKASQSRSQTLLRPPGQTKPWPIAPPDESTRRSNSGWGWRLHDDPTAWAALVAEVPF